MLIRFLQEKNGFHFFNVFDYHYQIFSQDIFVLTWFQPGHSTRLPTIPTEPFYPPSATKDCEIDSLSFVPDYTFPRWNFTSSNLCPNSSGFIPMGLAFDPSYLQIPMPITLPHGRQSWAKVHILRCFLSRRCYLSCSMAEETRIQADSAEIVWHYLAQEVLLLRR